VRRKTFEIPLWRLTIPDKMEHATARNISAHFLARAVFLGGKELFSLAARSSFSARKNT
jgi:hypothetical protein